MAEKNGEFKNFDEAMSAIIKADPKAVKAAMEAKIKANAAERRTKGELKRGRKPKSISASDRASSE
ncbi:MAG TPA: hypothetical protein VHW46_05305 [Terracidiphilus sp.]|nr:hypothetical protein [Terracidiphilus sp.]